MSSVLHESPTFTSPMAVLLSGGGRSVGECATRRLVFGATHMALMSRTRLSCLSRAPGGSTLAVCIPPGGATAMASAFVAAGFVVAGVVDRCVSIEAGVNQLEQSVVVIVVTVGQVNRGVTWQDRCTGR